MDIKFSTNPLQFSSSSSHSPNLISSIPYSALKFTKLAFTSPNHDLTRGVLVETSGSALHRSKRLASFKVNATVAETDQPKWWEKNAGPNMIDIHSTQEFLGALSQAGDKLVIVEFYGTWCASCRALFPKICKTAEEHSDILFLKVNFDENKPMCKSLNVKVLPFFHFYRGTDGLVDSFSCSLAKFQKIKEAISKYKTGRSSNGPPKGVGDLQLLEASLAAKDKPTESTS